MNYRCEVGFENDPLSTIEGHHEYLPPEAFVIEGLPPEIHQHLPSTINPHVSIETLMGTIRRVSKDYVSRKRKNRDATLKHISNNITIAMAQIDQLALRDNSDSARAHLLEKIRCYQMEYAKILKDSVSHDRLTESTSKPLDQETP